MNITLDPTQAHRRQRLEELLARHGCACLAADLDGSLGRWALMESDAGPRWSSRPPSPWWTTGSDWQELLSESADHENAQEWRASMLYDLDSDWSSEIDQVQYYVPNCTPPA